MPIQVDPNLGNLVPAPTPNPNFEHQPLQIPQPPTFEQLHPEGLGEGQTPHGRPQIFGLGEVFDPSLLDEGPVRAPVLKGREAENPTGLPPIEAQPAMAPRPTIPGVPDRPGQITGGGGATFGQRQPHQLPFSVENILDRYAKGQISRHEVHKQLKAEGYSVNLRNQREWEITEPGGRILSIPHFLVDDLANQSLPPELTPEERQEWEAAYPKMRESMEGWRRSTNIEDRRAYGQTLYGTLKTLPSRVAAQLWAGAEITIDDIKLLMGVAPPTLEDMADLHRNFFREDQ